MAIEHGKIDGDVILNYELVLHGMVTGNVSVARGGVLILHGTCSQNLAVEKNGQVYLHGTVAGNVLNRGGYLEIYGTVSGHVHTNEGNTLIDPGAVIKKGVSRRQGEPSDED
jgi:cytoskeletal protein CcmA (bactofilin family)